MTVSASLARKVIAGAGWSNPLSFAIYIESSSHIEVWADDTLLALGTHYTVAGVANPAGFDVTILSPSSYATVENWVLLHKPPLTQGADLSAGGAFGLAYENATDALVRRIQAVDERAQRALKLPLTSDGAEDFEDRVPLGRADGTFEPGPTASEISGAATSASASAASASAAAISEAAAAASASTAEDAASEAAALTTFIQPVIGAVSRPFASKLGETKSVKDFGAVGDGVTDDTVAFQTALDNHSHVVVPPGKYILNGTLEINDYNVLTGFGPHNSGDADGSAWLVFNIAAAPCFKNKVAGGTLLHAGFMGLTISAAAAATWIWDFENLSGLKMAFIRANTLNDATGGFHSVKATQSSWVVNWTDVEIRITDASTQYAVDTDISDSALLGGHYTGGKGVILRGTGGTKLIGARVDRVTGYGVTISNETESKSQHTIMGNQIELCSLGGVLVDGDADDTLTETWCVPIIQGNHFRNAGATQDILFKNDTGPALFGGTVGGNSHNEAAVIPVNVSGDWKRITTFPGGHASPTDNQPKMLLGQTFRQPVLVLNRGGVPQSHTGDITETTLTTNNIPANALGISGGGRVTCRWKVTNSANSKTMRLRVGGTVLGSVSVGAQRTVKTVWEFWNRGSAASQVGEPANFTGVGSSANDPLTGAVDTTVTQAITLTAELANSGETITLESYLIEIFPSSA